MSKGIAVLSQEIHDLENEQAELSFAVDSVVQRLAVARAEQHEKALTALNDIKTYIANYDAGLISCPEVIETIYNVAVSAYHL